VLYTASVAPFDAAGLAYGRVASIRASVLSLLARIGPHPSRFVASFDPVREAHVFDGFVHRFTRGRDVALLLHLVRQVKERAGSLESFFIESDVDPDAPTVGPALDAFGRRLFALDARPFSFDGQETPKPSYRDAQIVASFAGPLRIPNLLRNGPNMFLGYQRTIDHNTSTQSAVMPTALERAGDFSRTRDAFGRPVQPIDPLTGRPFADNAIPQPRLSPQATSLLAYYPLPNVDRGERFNYQAPVLEARHQDAGQARLSQVLSGGKNQIFGTLALQRTTTDAGTAIASMPSTPASTAASPTRVQTRRRRRRNLRRTASSSPERQRRPKLLWPQPPPARAVTT
jgi:hypothetical protein